MDLSFEEKSAWGSLLGLGLVAYWYFPKAFAIAIRTNDAADIVVISVVCIVALIIIEAIYQSIIAVRGGEDRDERDALIDLKAELVASYVLSIGMFLLVARIFAASLGDRVDSMGTLLIAVCILFALTVSEISKLITQVWYYRSDA